MNNDKGMHVMTACEIRKIIIKYYKELHNKGALMSLDEIKRIEEASDIEILEWLNNTMDNEGC